MRLLLGLILLIAMIVGSFAFTFLPLLLALAFLREDAQAWGLLATVLWIFMWLHYLFGSPRF